MSYLSWFDDEPESAWAPGLGAGGGHRYIKPTSILQDDSDQRFQAFHQAWTRGASVEELFGGRAFKIHGSVGPSGSDNHRPDVAKAQTLLHRAGQLALPDGPSGYYNQMTHEAIGSYQKLHGLVADNRINPDGPTIRSLASAINERKPNDAPQAGGDPQRKRPQVGVGGVRQTPFFENPAKWLLDWESNIDLKKRHDEQLDRQRRGMPPGGTGKGQRW